MKKLELLKVIEQRNGKDYVYYGNKEMSKHNIFDFRFKIYTLSNDERFICELIFSDEDLRDLCGLFEFESYDEVLNFIPRLFDSNYQLDDLLRRKNNEK